MAVTGTFDGHVVNSASAIFAPPAPKVPGRMTDFTLDVPGSKGLDVVIGESLLSASLELTIEGASSLTLTLDDSARALLSSDTLSRWVWGDRPGQEDAWVRRGRAVDAKLGNDVDLRLVKVNKAGTILTLTFEERIAAYLRHHKGARKVSRGKVTRAEFVKMLVDEVKAEGGIAIHAPELHKKQPIKKASQRKSKTSRSSDGEKGLDPKANLSIDGKRLTASQRRKAERILDVSNSHNAGAKAELAMMVAAIGESKLGDQRGSRGTTFQTLEIPESDLEGQAAHFLTGGRSFRAGGSIGAAGAHPSWSAGKIASYVEVSDADGSYYDGFRDDAQRIIDAYHGGGGRTNLEGTYAKSYEFSRGARETSWDAIGRLAEEVNWRRFVRQGRLWFVSEEYLFQQKPQLHVEEGQEGIDYVDFDVDLGARDQIAEVTVTARTDRWTALPGMVSTVGGSGPANGRWLVSSIQLSLLDSTGSCQVTLRKPLPALLEPAHETEQRPEESGTGSTGDGSADAVYTESMRISDQNRAYVYGGGHGKKLSQIGAREGLDCSSSCALALKRAGLFDGDMAIVSGEFASSWGKPGKGKGLTVWANGEHVWIEFNLSGKRGKRFDTSPHGSGPSGPHVRYADRSTAGFTPRHWPGI